MRRILTILLLVWPLLAAAGDLVSNTLRGQSLLLSRQYGEAVAQFKKIEAEYPESPAGSFGQMALWQVRMFENRDFRFISPYKIAEKKMVALCNTRLESRPTDWDLFVCGAGFGMKGFFDARQEKWLQGIGDAQRAVRSFKRLLYQNPQFVDAEMGIGMYEFWRSVVTAKYNWLPFFSDQRAQGVARLERAMRMGKYTPDLAKANLAYMAIELKDNATAKRYLEELAAKYPRNVLFRQGLGEIAWAEKRFGDCAKIYAAILREDASQTRSLYWMGAAEVIPFLKVDKEDRPRADAAIPPDVVTEARGYFNRYLTSHPIPVWAAATHYWLGLIAEWQRDVATARAEYEMALSLDKGVKEVKKRLALLPLE